ncbi:MAG: flavin reductase family protein [Candidatus Omnitrophota bacterium]
MAKKAFPLSEVYRLLEPGAVVMISTALGGRPNIMTMSWHTMIDFSPPLVGLVIGDQSHTFRVLKRTRECVINIPTARLLGQAVACGNHSGRTVDKFRAFGLTPVRASCVKAPMIAECYANLECKVVHQALAARYNFFIGKVVRAWIDPKQKATDTFRHLGKGMFMTGGTRIRTRSKMK